MIALDDLHDLRVCFMAKEAFAVHFPDGAPSWQAVADHPECAPNWIGWIAAHAPDLTLDERVALAAQSEDPYWWTREVSKKWRNK